MEQTPLDLAYKWSQQYGVPINIKKGLPNAYYDRGADEITWGSQVGDPTILAHEIGHFINKADPHPKNPYSTGWGDAAAITAILGIPALVKMQYPESILPEGLLVGGALAYAGGKYLLAKQRIKDMINSEIKANEKALEVYPEADKEILDSLIRIRGN